MLGAFKAERNGKVASFRTQKTASLLAYLVFYAGRPVSKDVLADALWPHSDTEHSRHSLRMAVSSIRTALRSDDWVADHYIESTKNTLCASADGFESDVGSFLSHLESTDLADALNQYSGPLLQGFGEDWVAPQAIELEELYAQAACQHIVALATNGNIDEAVRVGRHAIGMCAPREDLHVALMRAFSLVGQPSRAVAQFEELERMLDDVWGEQPSVGAREVLESLPQSAVVEPAFSTRSAEESSSSIRVGRSPFVGRESELSDLESTLTGQNCRLVTLIGLGGTGKTRLALESARRLKKSFGGNVAHVGAVGSATAAQLHSQILAAVAIQPMTTRDPIVTIVDQIGETEFLLVLDNLEQVAGPASETITTMLSRCTNLRVLATSRIPLGAPDEKPYPVSPLPLPSGARDLDSLRSSPSVQLLVAAAQEVRPGFAVTPANAGGVALLCNRLEGIPLAIEIAAAKLATMTPAQVTGSIGRLIDLSTSREWILDRHRSLEAVVQWSVEHLSEQDRWALASLGVCRGGFGPELANAILGEHWDDHVQRLCKSSLVFWTESEEHLRFDMLETVREIALALLRADPKREATVLVAQFQFARDVCAALPQDASQEVIDPWADQIGRETLNVLAALETAAAGLVSAEEAWGLALPLRDYYERRGNPSTWITPLEDLLAATSHSLSPHTLALAHGSLHHLHYGLRDIAATHEHLIKAIEAADKAGDVELQGEYRVHFAISATLLGKFAEAEKELTYAVRILGDGVSPRFYAKALVSLGWILFDRGDEESSEAVFRESLNAAESDGGEFVIAEALIGLASAVGHTRYEEAQPLFDRAIEYRIRVGMPSYVYHCLYYRALIDYRAGRFEEAKRNIVTSLEGYIDLGIALGQTPLTIAGNVFSAIGDSAKAARLWGKAEGARRKYSLQMFPTIRRDFERERLRTMAATPAGWLESEIERSLDLADDALLRDVARDESFQGVN
jgi:predicted ATPase/DNA-binding SARP family transcriptional activator